MVPRYTLPSAGWHAYSVATASVWNSYTDYLRDLALKLNSFRCQLKTFVFAHY